MMTERVYVESVWERGHSQHNAA